MDKELVSIIMPAFNAAAFISESIDSVLRQTYRKWELIIINDCSYDATADIIRRYKEEDSRIIILTNEMNQGVSTARNRGVCEATGHWIAYLDSDDIWTPDKLEQQMQLVYSKDMDGERPDLIFTGSAFIDRDSELINYCLEIPERISYHELLKQNVISCSSVLVRKELALKYPMKHDEMHEDYAVWLQILKDGGCVYGINQPLLIYRLSATSKSGNKKKAAVMTFRVYRFMGLNLLQSFYYFCWYTLRNLKKYYAICHNKTDFQMQKM